MRILTLIGVQLGPFSLACIAVEVLRFSSGIGSDNKKLRLCAAKSSVNRLRE